MQGHVDTSFTTQQRDLFESGLVAQIGVNAYAIWCAIKSHSDYQTGVSWPSVRRMMELTGLASATVQKALATLEAAKLLRSEVRSKRRYYIARERMDVRLGDRVLCTIVVDYVPAKMRQTLARVQNALKTGEQDADAFADVEIIPGAGFAWHEPSGTLQAKIPAREIPIPILTDDELVPLAKRVQAIAKRLPKK